MRIVVGPDSFKGSLSAQAVADCMEEAIYQVFPQAEVRKLPLADGGEGTVRTIVSACGGEIVPISVTGPLGNPVDAHWGFLSDGCTAVIEMAAASGLLLVPPEQLNPLVTTTYGTGELILAALDRGCQHIIIGIGGSATNDGGAGMLRALGVKLLDAQGQQIQPGGLGLKDLTHIDTAELDPRLRSVQIEVACDVDNPLFGPSGASHVFGPQKGASPHMVELLDNSLRNYAECIKSYLGVDVANMPGAGAAGGLGAGLMAFTGATLRSGIEIVSDLLELGRRINGSDLVITGEGRIDEQTERGKAILGVAQKAHKLKVPVIVMVGSIAGDPRVLRDYGVTAVYSIIPGPIDLSSAMTRAYELLFQSTVQVMTAISIGMDLK